jgi:putative hydrolase of the HAD superfamily
VLNDLKSSYRLGIISNAGDAANVARLMDKGGFRDIFDPILISAALRRRKPSTEVFRLVMQAWDLPADDLVMVGDTLGADILGAQRVGMHQIWLSSQADRPDNLGDAKRIRPELTATTLREVADLVRSLDRADRRPA